MALFFVPADLGMPFLFEFMDLTWLPSSLGGTLREILECACSRPFRSYYAWVADSVLQAARAGSCTTLVELGAGPAPVTQLLAQDARADGLRLVPCDANPDRVVYEALARDYPGKVLPRLDPVDFSLPQRWGPGTLLYLSATFHHIPPQSRQAVLQALTESAEQVLVFESLRKDFRSLLFVLASLLPALALPLRFLGRRGCGRRFFWCWLLPVAPLLFSWDTFVSCLRMWSDHEWRDHLSSVLKQPRSATVTSTLFSQTVAW
jgi:hypothetical protein